MEVLGHSQIAITMNLYAHVLPATRKEAAARMDGIFAPPPRLLTGSRSEPSNRV